MTTAHEAWAVVIGCPAAALTGRFQLRQSDYEAAGAYLGKGCKIVEPERFGESGITHQVFPPCDEVSLTLGAEAVRLLNEGHPMPLDFDSVQKAAFADQEDL